MRISYRPLVRIRLQHSYFIDGRMTRGCAIKPAPSTRIRLEEAGLVFRTLPDGCAIYCETVPESKPPSLLRPLGDDPLRLVLLIEPLSGLFEQITALPALPRHCPAFTVFHFSNLWKDEAEGRLYLTDPVANRRIGDAIELVTTPSYTHRLGSAETAVELSIKDMFGHKARPIAFRVVSQKVDSAELKVDLGAIPGLRAGRYSLADSLGGNVQIYYDPDLKGRNPIGIIELFSSTDQLTASGQNLVPEEYRFISSGTVAEQDYHIRFERLATFWRYRVTKRYGNNQIELNHLSITGPVDFTRSITGDCAVFTSSQAISMPERPHSIELKQNGIRIQRLPNPNPCLSLKKGDGADQVSEVNVYV